MTGLAGQRAAALPAQQIAGVAVASVAALMMLLCFGAGLLARAAFARSLSARFEARLHDLYPRYGVIKAMPQGLHGAAGQQVLNPVRVSFDDHRTIACDIEGLGDGRAVVYLPGAPDPWSGSMVLVPVDRLLPLTLQTGALAASLRGLGKGTGKLLGTAAA